MTARRALLIGCAKYDDPSIQALRAPAHDVAGVGRALADPDTGGFVLTTLLDAPEVAVRRTLGKFLRQAGRTDLLLVYLSCHGFKDLDGELYLGARDTELTDVPSTAVPADLLRRMIDQSPSKRTVLVLDCCFSGAITRSLAPRAVDDVAVGEILHGQGEGRVVITAARATEYAYEPSAQTITLRENPLHSVFAEAFIKGIETGAADLDGDGAIAVSELYEYVHAQVVASGSAQTPGIWNRLHGKLFLTHRPPPDRVAAPPETLPARPRSPYDADVLEWVFGAREDLVAALRPAQPTQRQAWRAARNGDWGQATPMFRKAAREDGDNPGARWGSALGAAVDEDWVAAGSHFAAAAELLRPTRLDLYAGAALLSSVALRAASSPRWYEPLEEAQELVPSCPQVQLYRGVHGADEGALSLALQLAPELVDDFAAIGVDVGEAMATALTQGEQRAALLLRTRAAVASLRRRHRSSLELTDLSAHDGPVPARAGSAPQRLRAVNTLIEAERRILGGDLLRLQEIADVLLAGTPTLGTMALLAATRETSANVVDALRATDRPAPVRAIGIPPRRPWRA
jgi:hypothetical protein